MHVLIIGAAGMIGRKLAARLIAEGHLGNTPLEKLTLADVIAPTPPTPTDFSGTISADIVNLTKPEAAAQLIDGRPDVIFHLAAIVSADAERHFDKGYAVNLDGSRFLLDAIRQAGRQHPFHPRLVFASSAAVFGAPFPETIDDDFHLTPLTSYGTQKAIVELLLADYTRKGFCDGVALRLPTICVRPGSPNKAASGFFSNIIREPLIGKEAVLPVSDTVRHPHASPRAAVGFMIHAATLDLKRLGWQRALTMPGLSVTVGEQIAALERVAGAAAVKLIRRQPDPEIATIVHGWAQHFESRRARDLGFTVEADFDAIIQAHIDDELGGHISV